MVVRWVKVQFNVNLNLKTKIIIWTIPVLTIASNSVTEHVMMEETDVSDADLLAAVEYLDPHKIQMYHWKIKEDYFKDHKRDEFTWKYLIYLQNYE